ncbi:hypothetical protein CKO23_21535 [Thiocystis violacea]|nr:hypothetical protein [Thiocystis violacea]
MGIGEHDGNIRDLLRFQHGGADKGGCLCGAVSADRVNSALFLADVFPQIGQELALGVLPTGE